MFKEDPLSWILNCARFSTFKMACAFLTFEKRWLEDSEQPGRHDFHRGVSGLQAAEMGNCLLGSLPDPQGTGTAVLSVDLAAE